MTWPVAAASTTTRSQSARPSIDSRTSQHTLPMVRISFTPGAAVATKSSMPASGPSRPMIGTRRLSRRYSARLASVSIAISEIPGTTSRGLKLILPASKRSAIVPFASTLTTRTRLPCRAATSASAAATVLLPTPPLPVTTRRRRPSRSGSVMPVPRSALGLPPEADLPGTVVDHELDVADLVGRDPDLAALAVLEPDERRAVLDRVLERRDDRVGLGVGLERQLFGGVHHTDADFHASGASGVAVREAAPIVATGPADPRVGPTIASGSPCWPGRGRTAATGSPGGPASVCASPAARRRGAPPRPRASRRRPSLRTTASRRASRP